MNKIKVAHYRMVDPASRSLIAEHAMIYGAWTNSHGAVCAVLDDGRHLGLKPDEFEVVDWFSPCPRAL